MASSLFLQQAYLAYFGRPVDATAVISYANVSEATVIANFSSSAESKALYPTFGLSQINAIYNMLFGRDAELAGANYHLKTIADGIQTPASVALAILKGALNADITAVNNKLAASAAFTASLDTTAKALGYVGDASAASARAFLSTVTDKVVADAAAVSAAIVSAVAASSTVASATSSFTVGQDTLGGTSAADTFVAVVAQNMYGSQTNQLATGDKALGGAGVDTLLATVQMANPLGGSATQAITPTTTSVEKAYFTALTTDNSNANLNVQNVNEAVVINAKYMTGLTNVGSVQSDASLTIQNLTTLTDTGVYADRRNTESVTIRMDHTGNDKALDAASNLTVLFDNDYLVAGKTSADNAYYFLEDRAGAALNAAKPLAHIQNDGIKFTVAGVTKTVTITAEQLATFQTTDGTWAGYTALLKGALALAAVADKSLVGLELSLSTTVFRDKGLDGTALAVRAPAIVLSSNTVAVDALGFSTPADSVGQYDVFASISNQEPTTTILPVTSNIELLKAGRGAEGGNLTIGAMSTDLSNSNAGNYKPATTTAALKQGVEVFNISVEGDATQFSSLASLQSTNNTLKVVNVVNKAGSAADLIIGNHNTAGAALKDVQTFNAATFANKLTLDASITPESIAKYLNLKDVAALPAGDNVAFTYTGGTSADKITVAIDGAAAGSRSSIVAGMTDFSFSANGGAGDDAITVSLSNTVQGVAGTYLGGAEAWYTNQRANAVNGLNNVVINGGEGNDTIRKPGAGDVTINGEGGNDTIYTDNTGTLATANSTGQAGTASQAYSNAAAAELAAAKAAAVASNVTGFVMLAGGENTAAATTTDLAAAALDLLDLITPASYAIAVPVLPLHSVMVAGITAATTSGGLTFAQNIALNAAYGNTATAGVVTPVATNVAQSITGFLATADATVMTQAQFDAGNALLATYNSAAKAAAALASSNDTHAGVMNTLLDTSQALVVTTTQAVNAVFDPSATAPTNGLTFTVATTTSGAAATGETQTLTFGAITAGSNGSFTVGGVTVTVLAADTAQQITDKVVAAVNAVVAGTAIGDATASNAAGTSTTVTITYTAPYGDVTQAAVVNGTATLSAIPTAATTVAGVNAIASVFTATVGGTTGQTGQTITFDGITHNVAGLTPTQVAALINTDIDGATWTDTDNAAGVVTFTAITPGVLTIPTSGAVVSYIPKSVAGTQTTVNNLAALNTALALAATDATVVTALQAALANGSITPAQLAQLFSTVVATAGAVDATELLNAQAILTPWMTTAANANTTAQAALTAAIAADVTAQSVIAQAVAITPAGASASPDFSGTAGTAAAATAATAAVTTANGLALSGLTVVTKIAAGLTTLKAAIALGTTDLAVVTATQNAFAAGVISAANKAAIDGLASAVTGTVGVVVNAAEKVAVDLAITVLQTANDILLADATLDAANLGANVAATALAKSTADNAALSGNQSSLTVTSPKAVFVFNTNGQNAPYVLAQQDDRNLADLRSDVNNSNSFFNATVKVSYKGIDVLVPGVAGTSYKTSDLEINQAIKAAINDPLGVLSKLLVATDGPANTLVVTSLIDGVQTTSDLVVQVIMPTAVSAADLAGAIAAGLVPAASTEATLLTALTAAKTAFDTKGDYVTQFAESGAVTSANVAGNVNLTGGNSTSSTDNTITGGAGNDVIVLSTTVGVDILTASNETIVFATGFGNDTIVNFTAGSAVNADVLNFVALNGSGKVALNSPSLDKSIFIGAPVLTSAAVLTDVQIAALFTDSATAINHVYVAVDATNIGSIWQVSDAAGVAAGNITAKLVGTIDLASTSWASLTAANFV